MYTHPKIIVSLLAREKLLEYLNINSQYTNIRLKCILGCCGSPKVEIELDKALPFDTIFNDNGISYAMDEIFIKNIKELQLIYESSTFKMKIIPISNITKPCAHTASSEKSSCGEHSDDGSSTRSCSGSGCSGSGCSGSGCSTGGCSGGSCSHK